MWGGWGNDYLNADDFPGTGGGLNDGPDTNPSWEDFVYGGAGSLVVSVLTILWASFALGRVAPSALLAGQTTTAAPPTIEAMMPASTPVATSIAAVKTSVANVRRCAR